MKRQFSKDGHVTTATDAAMAVLLRFDGWQDVPEPETPPDPAPAAETSKPTPRKSTRSHR